MNTLLIQTEPCLLQVHLPTPQPMSTQQLEEFCRANEDLRIEQTAQGDVIVMSPASADTGNRNFNIATQLG
jgi:Uma2 family endonuclease